MSGKQGSPPMTLLTKRSRNDVMYATCAVNTESISP